MTRGLKKYWTNLFGFFFLVSLLFTNSFLVVFAAHGESDSPDRRCPGSIHRLMADVGEKFWALPAEEFKKIRPQLQRSAVDKTVKVVLAKKADLESVELQLIFEVVWTEQFQEYKFHGPWWSTRIFENPTSFARQIFLRLDKDRDFQILNYSERLRKKLNLRRLLYFWLPPELSAESVKLQPAWQFETARAALELWDHENDLLGSADVEAVVGVSWDRLVGRGDFAAGAPSEKLRIFENESQFYGFVFKLRERERVRNPKLNSYDLRRVDIKEPSALIREALAQLDLRDPK